MTLVSDLVAQARRYFMTSQRDRYQTLASSCTPTATSLTVTYDTTAQPTAVNAGSVVEVGIESMLVTAVSTTTLTVIRGFNGSKKVAHNAGDLMRINPVLLDLDLFTAINDELRDLSSPGVGLSRIDNYEFTAGGNKGYDLPLPLRNTATILGVFAVLWQEPRLNWIAVDNWKFITNANTTDFPSGYGLMFKGNWVAGRKHRVWYRAGFTTFDTINDDVTAVSGLWDEAVDVLAMGAAIRASETREIGRNFHERQGDTRRATEVPPGAQLQSATALRNHYMIRRSAERARVTRLERLAAA